MAVLRVGHVVIKMRDLEAAKRFYGDILGMKVAWEQPNAAGQPGVFFRFGDYHHDIAVRKVSEAADSPKADQVGLAHIALVVDSFASLKAMYQRLKEHRVPVQALDHGMTNSLYCSDPEGNRIELYCEVPEVDYLAEGFEPYGRPLDLEAALPAH